MNQPLSRAVCRIHFDRPATARCPGCKEFYCPECITEHDGKLTCAACLKRKHSEETAAEKGKRGKRFVPGWFQPMPLAQALLALAGAWLIFYFLVQAAARMPDTFHPTEESEIPSR